jgi:phospholipase/carboxylesterase
MKRIEHPAGQAKAEAACPELNIESGLFTSPGDDSSCVFFGPKHYEPNYAYPLLVWLHAPGGDERQLLRIMPTISLRNYAAVAPRGFQGGGAALGQGFGWPQSPESIHRAAGRVLDAVQAAQGKFHVAEERVFLAGFDAGGTMAFRVAMSHPGRFAGVLSICGAFPTGHAPFGRLIQARHLPVFLAVGRDSRQFPPTEACENLRLLHAAGISVMLRQYPCGQELTEPMLRDVDRWIMEQITQAASPHAESEPR